jgi:hypothetical protein
VPASKVDDAAAAEEAPNAPRHLPRFVELLAGQAACMADGASQPLEQRAAGEPIEIAVGQAAAGCW